MHRIMRRLAALIRMIGSGLRAELHAFARHGRLRPGTVLYESFSGNGALCNPEAIFRELLRSPEITGLRHVWVLDDLRQARSITTEFAHHRDVRFVRYRSLAYFRALATSEYLINNATFPPEFSKRAGQIYLNTWHGTPLKQMGYDMPGGALDSANTLRNFVAADFLLSQNPFMTERMYEKAYKLRGIFRGLVIEEGYPRVDRQFLSHDEFLAGRNRLDLAGLESGDRSIVLYAPTWHGDSFGSPDDDAQKLVDATLALQEQLGSNRFVVLLKTHQVVHRFAARNPAYRKLLVPNDIPTNTVLGLTSILVTDYSSIFFDFLASERPIVFYAPDANDYRKARGTYFESHSLPGPVCGTIAGVADAVRAVATDADSAPAPSARISTWRHDFAPFDDGSASRRVVDVVFRGRVEDKRVHSLPDDHRISMLLHLGGMRSNGITSSALNLLSGIDHTRYDVSVVFTRPRSRQQRANQARIDPRVRQFHRSGGMNGHKIAQLRRRLADHAARPTAHHETVGQRQLWDDEWRRCFGDSRFDTVVDFSGYSAFWATLLLHSPGGIRSIWLHNDMAAEVGRVIRGKSRMQRSLPAVFALYPQFESLVSVSPSLSQLNCESLASSYHLGEDSFRSARNLVDGERILGELAIPLAEIDDYAAADDLESATSATMPAWARQMENTDDATWFVTVGRYSSEKNQERLLRAFAAVHSETPSTRLVIVGYGPLRQRLEQLVCDLRLDGAAFIVGPFRNPFPIVAASSCFVLSSDYEGQPMVLLEAAIAGLPIVSVDFGSVRDALPNKSIHVVERTDEALAEGLRAYLRGEVPRSFLAIADYNRSAVSEFHSATLSGHPARTTTGRIRPVDIKPVDIKPVDIRPVGIRQVDW